MFAFGVWGEVMVGDLVVLRELGLIFGWAFIAYILSNVH